VKFYYLSCWHKDKLCPYDKNSTLTISSLELKLKTTKYIIFYFPLDKGRSLYLQDAACKTATCKHSVLVYIHQYTLKYSLQRQQFLSNIFNSYIIIIIIIIRQSLGQTICGRIQHIKLFTYICNSEFLILHFCSSFNKALILK
jgi:hypothetical protein